MPGFCQRYSSFRSNTDFRGQKKVCEYTRAAFLLPGSQTRSAVAALRILQLLLYLCSEEQDMPQIEHPQKRWTISGGVRSPKEPQVWDVGVRVSNAIWNYKNHERTAEKEMASVQGAHSSPRPHVRAAYWHTFWVGPRRRQSFRTGSPSSVGFHPFRLGWIGGESFPPTFIWFWKADT